jgi:hypothetical protein
MTNKIAMQFLVVLALTLSAAAQTESTTVRTIDQSAATIPTHVEGNTHTAAGPDPVALEHWRAVMAQNPPEEAGCFHESYPNLVREKVNCSAARPRVHPVHRTGGGPEEVGNGHDYVAETTGKTFWAGGSFLDVSVQSEASAPVYAFGGGGILGSNEYSLQLNTNELMTTSACDGSTTFGCHVWQQFVYATDYDCGIFSCDAGVLIQYWLLDYGECPANWNQESQDSNNCWINSSIAAAPDFPITDLANLSLHAGAKAGGQDCAVVYDNTGAGWGVCASDSVLDISSVWNKTEWGIFGDTGGSQAQFGFGTNFFQLLQVNDGSGAAPTCIANDGTTGETNNLNLGSCKTLVGNGLYPRIRFTESNLFKAPPPPNACGLISQGHGLIPGQAVFSCDGRFMLIMQTDGNLVLYQDGVALWNTGTEGQDVAYMIMQEDGNLVVYDTSEAAVWNSQTDGYEGAYLAIQDDGNLVIYLGKPAVQNAVWNSGTCCH